MLIWMDVEGLVDGVINKISVSLGGKSLNSLSLKVGLVKSKTFGFIPDKKPGVLYSADYGDKTIVGSICCTGTEENEIGYRRARDVANRLKIEAIRKYPNAKVSIS